MRRDYYSAKRRGIMSRGEQINHTEVFDAYDWVCQICGGKIDKRAGRDDWMRVTLDHIIPISRGGLHIRENTVPAHWKCNMEKGNNIPDEYQGKLLGNVVREKDKE